MNQVTLAPDFLDHRAGHLVKPHVHEEGQVLIATEGRMEVRLSESRIEIGRGTALWVPRGVRHAALSLDATAFRGIMVGRPHASLLPSRSLSFAATPLLLAAVPELKAPRSRRRALASSLLLDELLARLAVPQATISASKGRFADVCARVLDDPAQAPSLDEAARQAGSSRRSFSRAFRLATGQSWAAWVRDVRISQAAGLLADGAPVIDAALAVGYTTPSGFSVAFRRRAGRRPRELRPAES